MKALLLFRYTRTLIIVTYLMVFSSGCKKFLEVDPPLTSLTSVAAFEDDATAIALLTNIYASLSNVDAEGLSFGSVPTISIASGLGGDELSLSSVGQSSNNSINIEMMHYFFNELESNPVKNYGSFFWGNMYRHVYTCNAVLEGLQSSQKLSPNVAKQLTGEAKFLRAFLYFYLVNMYGDVPLLLNTDYKQNLQLGRTSKSTIYNQIITDLNDAKANLNDNFVDSKLTGTTTERIRPTKAAATALLARTYLYTKEWANAEIEASNVISSSQFGFVPLNSVFLKNSREAIWQLQPVVTGWLNTMDARLFIIPSSGFSISPNKVLYMNPDLYNAFEANDARKTAWVGAVTQGGITYRYPFKYKVDVQNAAATEYTMMLRFSEQFLIRAEARAHLGKLNDALLDLNAIRSRVGLSDINTTDQTFLLDRIMQERRVELFTELGHRWFDLKRTETIDAVMNIAVPRKVPNGTWKSYQQWYPIGFDEIQNAPNLTQNTGY